MFHLQRWIAGLSLAAALVALATVVAQPPTVRPAVDRPAAPPRPPQSPPTRAVVVIEDGVMKVIQEPDTGPAPKKPPGIVPAPPKMEKVGPDGSKERRTAFMGLPDSRKGVVTLVTDDSISLRDGKTDQVTRYPAHVALAAGKVQEGATDGNAYRLKDVKIGDVVDISLVTEGEVTYCVDIQIWKRPGGSIPQSQKPNRKPYHLSRQADIDAEEREKALKAKSADGKSDPKKEDKK